MPNITDDQIADWKKQHGAIYELCREDVEDIPALRDVRFIVRKPTRAELHRLNKTIHRDSTAAMQNLMLDVCLVPDRAKLGTIFNELPGVSGSLAQSLGRIIGTAADFICQEL